LEERTWRGYLGFAGQICYRAITGSILEDHDNFCMVLHMIVKHKDVKVGDHSYYFMESGMHPCMREEQTSSISFKFIIAFEIRRLIKSLNKDLTKEWWKRNSQQDHWFYMYVCYLAFDAHCDLLDEFACD
jgi:hypothetical protein